MQQIFYQRSTQSCVNMITACVVLICLVQSCIWDYGYAQTVPRPDDILASVYDNSLEPGLFANLEKECNIAHHWSFGDSSLIHSKKPTIWVPKSHITRPRTLIEEAILSLFNLLEDRMLLPGKKKSDIVGAEWWVQSRSANEDINFHYDKDEATASLEGKMVFPLASTVTYLSGYGGPTLVLNQITPDGNSEIPHIVEEGFLIYPLSNRHLIFRGDLQHGVLNSGTVNRLSSGRKRVTLLINWWSSVPRPPNCVETPSGLLKAMAKASLPDRRPSTKSVDIDPSGGLLMSLHGNHRQIPLTNLTIDSPIEKYNTHQFEIPPGDIMIINLPKDLSGSGAYAIKWGPQHSFGHVGKLDLRKSNQVGQLFRLQEPKAIFVYHPQDTATHSALMKAVFPLAKSYLDRIKVYLCTIDVCEDVLRAFDLPMDKLPYHLIDDTRRGLKHVQPAVEFQSSTITADLIENFWLDVLDKQI